MLPSKVTPVSDKGLSFAAWKWLNGKPTSFSLIT
jgi:hypothetical protein